MSKGNSAGSAWAKLWDGFCGLMVSSKTNARSPTCLAGLGTRQWGSSEGMYVLNYQVMNIA